MLQNSEEKQPLHAIEGALRERLPWLWQPAFKIDASEGFIDFVFGARAGPEDNLNALNVLHEVSHAIEITQSKPRSWKRRLCLPNHGLEITTFQTILGKRYLEPTTMQCTERECRVAGIQQHVLEMGGFDTRSFANDFVLTLRYLPDSHLGGDSVMNAHDPYEYTDEQKRWVQTRLSIVKASYDTWSAFTIQAQWSKVMAFFDASRSPDRSHGRVSAFRPG